MGGSFHCKIPKPSDFDMCEKCGKMKGEWCPECRSGWCPICFDECPRCRQQTIEVRVGETINTHEKIG